MEVNKACDLSELRGIFIAATSAVGIVIVLVCMMKILQYCKMLYELANGHTVLTSQCGGTQLECLSYCRVQALTECSYGC